MLKKRIIPVQLLLNGRLVKTVRFGSPRDVGDPVSSSKVYTAQDADELVFLNIDRDARDIRSMSGLIGKVAEVCFVPLAAGGGVRTVQDAEVLIKNGADKVVINSACYADKTLLRSVAERYGAQAVVVGIDARREPSGGHRLYSDCGRAPESVDIETHVKEVIRHGAGEIFVNSIDRDGTMTGYDVDLVRRVAAASSVPVIACGGAGDFMHMRDLVQQTDVHALACGSLFNFGDNNPVRAKAFLRNYGLPFRVI